MFGRKSSKRYCVNHPDRRAVVVVGDQPVCADVQCMTGGLEAQTVVVHRDDDGNPDPLTDAEIGQLRRSGYDVSEFVSGGAPDA